MEEFEEMFEMFDFLHSLPTTTSSKLLADWKANWERHIADKRSHLSNERVLIMHRLVVLMDMLRELFSIALRKTRPG